MSTKQEQNYLELQPKVGIKISEKELLWNVAVLVLQSSCRKGILLLEIITAALALICVVKQCDTFVNQQVNNTNLESQKEFVSLKPGGSFFPHLIAINTLSGQRFWLLLLPPEPCMVRSGSGTVM